MNAVAVWIFLPLAAGGALLPLAARRRMAAGAAAGLAVVLALAASVTPIEQPVALFGRTLLLSGSWDFFGRHIVLTDAARPWLVWLYGGAFLWMMGARWVETSPFLPSAALLSLPLWIAALAVQPFVYAPAFLFFGVLAWVPALTWERRDPGGRVLRFLTLQLLALPLLLVIGWMLAGVETLAGQEALALRAGVLTAIGVSFLLGVFPFHVWYPSLAGGGRVYAAGMLLTLLPWGGLLLGLRLLDTYAWLREAPFAPVYLRSAGMTTLLSAALLALLETRLGRLWGYALMAETGMALLAAAVYPSQGLRLFSAAAWPHLLAGVLGAFALARLRTARGGLDFPALEGAARAFPLEAAGALVALFSLAGYPLLAAFPLRMALWRVYGAFSPLWGAAYMAGMVGMMGAGLRTLAVLATGDAAERQFPSRWVQAFLLLNALLLLGSGVFFRLVFPLLEKLGRIFPQL